MGKSYVEITSGTGIKIETNDLTNGYKLHRTELVSESGGVTTQIGAANPLSVRSVIPFTVKTEITSGTGTSYTQYNIINAAAAEGFIELDLSSYAGAANRLIQISSIGLLSSQNIPATPLTAIGLLFNAAAPSSQTSFHDATAFAVNYTDQKNSVVAVFEDISTVIKSGTLPYNIVQTDLTKIVALDADGKLYLALLANNAYTKANGEAFTITVKGYLL